MIQIHAIPAFADNYIWLIEFGEQQAAVIDPGDGQLVLEALQQRGLSLAAILITHHHWDHVGGIETLLNQHKVPVYGPHLDDIPGLSHPCHNGDQVQLGELQLEVMEVPGHTRGHLAYYGHQSLFCGDTLFAAGCGRLMGGSVEQMHASLKRIAALSPETMIYCAHEYTLANLRFAQAVEPGNPAVNQRLANEQRRRDQGLATVPSPLALELETNPFLRCHDAGIVQAAEQFAGHKIDQESDVFGTLRFWKDGFS